MAKICYVNGQYIHHRDAMVHMDDRGYLFADGIYEVIAFYNRTILDEALHMKRLARSLKELAITPPMSASAMKLVIAELMARNSREDGSLYIQITRGVAKRDHIYPKDARAALVMSLAAPKNPKPKEVKEGVGVITLPDIRWQRRDIKSISLLPNVMARQASHVAGTREAWLCDEGSASNAFIVNAKGELITHPATHAILGGVTRDVVLSLARKAGVKVVERPFSLKEAKQAKEAFITSTSANVLPVVTLDGAKIGVGVPGVVTQKLLGLYLQHIFKETGRQWE